MPSPSGHPPPRPPAVDVRPDAQRRPQSTHPLARPPLTSAPTRNGGPNLQPPLVRTATPARAGLRRIPSVIRPAVLAATILLAAAASGLAAASASASPPAAGAPPRPPMVLPGDAAAASVDADPGTWLVGARPTAAANRVARARGGRRVGVGVYVVARGRARALASALRARGLLAYAEPNRLARRAQAPPPDPLDGDARWRAAIVAPDLVPPPVSPTSPLLVLIDSRLDEAHPEFGGGNVSTLGDQPLTDAHGTATAAIAAAPKNDLGILGVWPGMRALNVPLPDQIRCADSVRGIARAMEQNASVINMSYGSPGPCFAEYTQLQLATARGISLVSSAGNEAGETYLFPASLPHVITVGAVGADYTSAAFSSASAALDVTAPGVGILTATPPQFDGDGQADGYEAVSGTSFSSPMVAAAATWVRAARPQLAPDQVTQILRLSARDLGDRGWDVATGFGLLSVGAALARPMPPRDALEPNDDMDWVNGRVLGKPSPAAWSGGRPRRLHAMVDQFEDPADVYRVILPRRARVRVTVQPLYGDADLAAFTRSASSTADDEQLIGRSNRNGRRRDSLTLQNPSRRKRLAYLVAYIDRAARGLDSAYQISFRRSRR